MNSIMLIDDDKDVIKINSDYLIGEGYQVAIYYTADDAISALASHNPDCILLDIMMPGTDGLSAVPIIKKADVLSDNPSVRSRFRG